MARFTYHGKNVDITPALKKYAEKKIGRASAVLSQPTTFQVHMRVDHGDHIVEVTANVNGYIIRGSERSHDMYASIDRMADQMERRLRKYKGRIAAGRRNGRRTEPAANTALDQTEPLGPVVRRKRFALKPISTDEAIVQMDLLGHDFFVFRNADNDQVSVLYRRQDGQYGLIEPDV